MQKNKSEKVNSTKSLLTGSILAALIVATPYFFYLYEGFPDTKVWESSFLGIDFSYNSNYYESVYYLSWIVIGKVIPLFLLFIWFFTCKHWWYHAILVPIFMYIFQIYTTINDDLLFHDSGEIYILAPIIFIAFIFLYTIRTRIFDKIHNIDLSELRRVTLKGRLKNNKEENTTASSTETDEDEAMYMG